jgi:GAF domain-containing protein
MRGRFGGVPACIPEDEAERLAILRSIQLLDTPPEERFDRFTRLAARVFDVPISLLTFVDEDRQWFKSRVGLPLPETSRNTSFCAHAILEDSPLVVPDALQDERFEMNPLVTGDPRIRFYAGVPLKISGQAVGTLCLIDTRPRSLSKGELDSLQDFGSLLEKELQC